MGSGRCSEENKKWRSVELVSDDESRLARVQIRPRAVNDIERHAEYLEDNAPPDVALRFRIAIMDAIDQIAFMPTAGSPREAKNTLLRGLRMWVVPGFRNYLVFYLTPQDRIEIIRVFHGAQDIKNILDEEE